jgi:hypothetical protein
MLGVATLDTKQMVVCFTWIDLKIIETAWLVYTDPNCPFRDFAAKLNSRPRTILDLKSPEGAHYGKSLLLHFTVDSKPSNHESRTSS